MWKILAAITTLCLISLALHSPPAAAQNILRDVGEREGDPVEPRWLALPYAFKTESLDWSFGAGIGGSGYGQDQLMIMATGFATLNDSWAGFAAFNDLKLPLSERLFIDGKGMVGNYTDQRVYGDLTFDSPDDRAGSNTSDKTTSPPARGGTTGST